LFAGGGPVVQRHLAADEPELLRDVRAGARRVELQLVAHRPAEEGEDRLAPQTAEQIVEREVDAADRVEHDAAAAVEERRAVHLIPDALDVGDGPTLEEAREVLLDDPRADL